MYYSLICIYKRKKKRKEKEYEEKNPIMYTQHAYKHNWLCYNERKRT